MVNSPDRVQLYLVGSTPVFFQHMTDAILPHLKLVHRFPHCFPTIGIDRGAIRFVLSGATLMAPGLTSAGGVLPEKEKALKEGDPVVIVAEGKQEATAVGLLAMGTEDVKVKGKGPVVEDAHYLGDGLWKLHTD
jgi:PUA domain protein